MFSTSRGADVAQQDGDHAEDGARKCGLALSETDMG